MAAKVTMITMASSGVERRQMRMFFQFISEYAIPMTSAERDAFGICSTMGSFTRAKNPAMQMSPAKMDANRVFAPDS